MEKENEFPIKRNLELERQVLNLILEAYRDEEIKYRREALNSLEEEDFYNDSYKKILRYMKEIFKENEIFDKIDFSAFLEERKERDLDKVILSFDTGEIAGSPLQLPKKIEKLKEIAKKREEQFKIYEVVDKINKGEEPKEVIEGFLNWYKKREKIKKVKVKTLYEDFDDIVKEFTDQEKIIPTGFKPFDDFLSGGLRSGVYALAGRPFVGKTTFLNFICDSLALTGIPSLYIHTEEPRARLLKRTLIRINETQEINLLEDFINSLKTDSELYTIIKNRAIIRVYEGLNLMDLVSQFRRKFENTPFLLVVDSLHNFPSVIQTKRDIKEEITERVRLLYDIVEEFQIPVIFTSFMPRSGYDKKDIGVFKESGNIEYLIDVGLVMGLPEGQEEKKEEEIQKELLKPEVKIEIAKVKDRFLSSLENQRNLRLTFKRSILTFERA